MQPLPHHYRVTATAAQQSNVELKSPRLSPLTSAPPAEFDGPGDLWSPETLFVAAIADCFVLTFKAIATASKMEWTTLSCEAEGTVDRGDGKTRFSAVHLRARLAVPPGIDAERARRMLEKAESTCLVSNSLNFEHTLETEVTTP